MATELWPFTITKEVRQPHFFTFITRPSTFPRLNSVIVLSTEADDEISFNPDEIITNIEMIDEGWWKGQCRGRVGLFPRAYVQLLQ